MLGFRLRHTILANQPTERNQPTTSFAASMQSSDSVERAQGSEREPALFRGACTCAEIIGERRWKLTPGVARDLLESSARVCGLWKEIGGDEVRRTIGNGLRHVEEKILATEENVK